MSEFPLGYERIAPTTWVYLSSLLMIGLFFKFNRPWSVRNLDLILLILLAPGLLLVLSGGSVDAVPVTPAVDVEDSQPSATPDSIPINTVSYQTVTLVEPGEAAAGVEHHARSRGQVTQLAGFVWLFLVGLMFVVRMLLDPTMVRRPLLEPNLTTAGLIFIGCSLFVFLMANVITSRPTKADLDGPRSAEKLIQGQAVDENDDSLTHHGPGWAILFLLPSVPTVAMSNGDEFETRAAYTAISKTMAILAHLAVVLGIVVIGYQHFDNLKVGVGVATLYLMLPYTALLTGRVDHVIPAALLVWAVFFYRRPLTAGIFIGLASGVVYYPLFLLPLWISFYWQRGLLRFVIGVVSMIVVLAFSLIFVSSDVASFWGNIQKMFGIWLPVREGLQGLWGLGWDPWFRLPLLFAFIALSITFALWPAQKNLGTLLSCSAAIMIATQFWHGYGGGLFMAWYLPLTLLTIFRPNLEDRVALSVLGDGWLSRRKRQQLAKGSIAA